MDKDKPNKKAIYTVRLERAGDKPITKKAETIYDALSAMDLTWNQIKGKGVIKVFTDDGRSREKVFNAVLLRRIFGSKDARRLWAGNLKFLLGDEIKTTYDKQKKIKNLQSKKIMEKVEKTEYKL